MRELPVRVGVLGPVVVWPGDGSASPALPAVQRGLLAALVLCDPPVTPDRLLALLWRGNPPASGRTLVHVVVSRLRKALRTQAADRMRVVHAPGGYSLELLDGQTDADRFLRLVGESLRVDDLEQRCELLDSALRLWRGAVAADTPDALRHCEPAQRLERERVRAAELLADAALRCGRAANALGHLSSLAEMHPFHERLHAKYALLLADQGQQAAAFDVLHTLTRRLADELGIDAGDDIRRAHELILHQLVGTQRPPRRTMHGVSWRGPRGHHSRIIGRDREQLALLQLLTQHQMVTITGPGGCGKTTLALRVAEDLAPRFPDGVLVLALTALHSAGELPAALAASLRVRSSNEDILDEIERALGGKNILLVLDNCEHLAEACASLVRRLLGANAKLTVLTTSRQPLGVPEERIWALDPLALPEPGAPPDPACPALALFLARAHEILPAQATSLTVEPALSLAAGVCRLLDGLPLALELAAAQLRALDITELHARLQNGVELLRRTTSGGDPRHLSLTDTIEWSYRLLTSEEQRLLWRLSAFDSSFSLSDAEHVCGFAPLGNGQVAELLTILAERSLVQPFQQGNMRRFRLLQAVRLFAAERCLEAGETDAVAHRLLTLLLHHARKLDALPAYQERVAAVRALDVDAPTIRVALDNAYATGHPDEAAEVTARLFDFWLTRPPYLTEGERWLERALATYQPAEADEIVTLLRFHQAMLRAVRGDYIANLDLMTGIVADLARFRPREHLEAQANLLTIRCSLLDPSALSEAVRAADSVRTSTYTSAGTVLAAAASVFATWGRYDTAAQALAGFQNVPGLRTHVPSPIHQALHVEIALGQGLIERAEQQATKLAGRLSDITNPAEQDPPRRAIALTHLVAGRHEQARQDLGQAIEWMRAHYPELDARLTALWLLRAEAERQAGHTNAALTSLSAGLDATANPSFRHTLPGVLVTAALAAELGHHDASATLASRWDALRRRLGLPVPLGFTRAAATVGIEAADLPVPDPLFPWDQGAPTSLIADARAWCHHQAAATEPR